MKKILAKCVKFGRRACLFLTDSHNLIAGSVRQFLSIIVVIFVLGSLSGTAFAEDSLSPEQVMVRFIKSFVKYDYDTCRDFLAPGATIAIVRRDGTDEYAHSIQPASDWLERVGKGGVKDLDSFSVDIHDAATLEHHHGTTVVLKFSAKGRAKAYRFKSSGFDTGNLIQTPDGWRILHYSSFENFETFEVHKGP